MTYKKSDFNYEAKTIVASGPGGIIVMVSNPAIGAVSYRLEIDNGVFAESKDLDRIISVYNKREKK
jgi:hypothetical protein